MATPNLIGAPEKVLIRQMWMRGVSVRLIAAEIGCSTNTISLWARRLNLPERHRLSDLQPSPPPVVAPVAPADADPPRSTPNSVRPIVRRCDDCRRYFPADRVFRGVCNVCVGRRRVAA